MRRAITVATRGSWPAVRAAGTATLGHDDRHRRRVKLATDAGEPFLLDLERPTRLVDGDGLVLDDGSFVLVRAAAEDCVLIRCADPATLTRVAWHLGNRHLPVQIVSEGLVIRADHVIVDMVRGLGASAEAQRRAFDPESGAYADGAHHHDHDHGHDHPAHHHHPRPHAKGHDHD